MLRKRAVYSCLSWLILLTLVCLVPAGAQSKKTYELMYEDIQTLKVQLQELMTLAKKNQADLQELRDQVKLLGDLIRRTQAEQTALKEDFRNIPVQFQLLNSKLEEVQFQTAILNDILQAIQNLTPPPKVEEKGGKSSKAQPARSEPPAAEAKKPAVVNIPAQELYNNAYGDYLKGNYSLAIDSFKLFLQQYPNTPLSDNALYWIGECHYSQEQYQEAIDAFNELLINYPSGDKVPAAYLKKGLSLAQLGRKEESLATLKLLVAKYPTQEEARLAQQKINELGKK
ncbi:MAG: tol-pal system protein YbgF [Candidatus Saccharicenans sp.]|uniref:tol-pal system protein YbgF n=1 Tax=Candidatus Saccharicenans sp. TaxID=2819258 RepID=UPI004049EBBF